MSSLKYYYIVGLVIVFAVLGALVVFLVSRSQPEFSGLNDSGPASAPQGPSAELWRNDDSSSLFLRCRNLPEGTADIQIFRSKLNETQWILWTTKRIYPGCDTEVIEIKILDNEDDPSLYKYILKAVDALGNGLWVSDEIAPRENPPALSGGLGTGGGSSASAPPPGGVPAVPVPGTGGDTGGGALQGNATSVSLGTPQGGAPAGGGGSGGASGNYCYTPSGQVAGPCESETGHFWVGHVDRRIEIGWQNLPSSTVSVVIYRAQAENGPWETLDEKGNINPNQMYFLRILDHTLGTPHYYRLDAKSASGALTQRFGPLLLPALE